jgi:hypothetical protein
MSISCRPEKVAANPSVPAASGSWRRLRLFAIAALLAMVPSLEAQVNNALRAIENLEGCSRKERKQACVNILKQQPAAGSKQAIKAQLRGGRIIWYEYDAKSGTVRRTN